MSNRFPKAARLRRRQEYQRLRSAQRKMGDLLSLEYRIESDRRPRLGITVTRSYGKAHERNRFKRIVREVFRCVQSDLPVGLQINVRPRTAAHRATMAQILSDFLKALESLA